MNYEYIKPAEIMTVIRIFLLLQQKMLMRRDGALICENIAFSM